MMCGCSTFATVRASRVNRSLAAWSPARFPASTLRATVRPSPSSWARNTTAIPPTPTRSASRYPATREPGRSPVSGPLSWADESPFMSAVLRQPSPQAPRAAERHQQPRDQHHRLERAERSRAVADGGRGVVVVVAALPGDVGLEHVVLGRRAAGAGPDDRVPLACVLGVGAEGVHRGVRAVLGGRLPLGRGDQGGGRAVVALRRGGGAEQAVRAGP